MIDQAKGAIMLAYGLDGALFERCAGVPSPGRSAAKRAVPSRLAFRRSTTATAVVLHVAGDVDMAGSAELAEQVSAAVDAAAELGIVVVDLTDIGHLGPSGIIPLVRGHRRSVQRGLRFHVIPDRELALVSRLDAAGLELVARSGALTGHEDDLA